MTMSNIIAGTFNKYNNFTTNSSICSEASDNKI